MLSSYVGKQIVINSANDMSNLITVVKEVPINRGADYQKTGKSAEQRRQELFLLDKCHRREKEREESGEYAWVQIDANTWKHRKIKK